MGKAKIAITLDAEYIGELDRLVEENYFQNRSQAIRDAVREKLARVKRSRLSMECAKLDPKFEKSGTVIAVGITSQPQNQDFL